MNPKTHALLIVAVLALAGCARPSATDPPQGPDVAGTDIAVFDGNRTLVDPARWLGGPMVPVFRQLERAAREPTIGVDPDGNIFVGVWDQEDFGGVEIPNDDELGKVLSVYASFDQGASWRNVRPAPGVVVQVPPTTSDAFLEVDPVTGRLLANDWTYGCSTMAISDDDGGAWTHSPFGCGLGNGAFDHQSIATGKPRASSPVGYERMVYYCVALHCAASTNGGLTFGPSTSVICPGPAPFNVDCSGANGHVKTDGEGRVLLGAKLNGAPNLYVSEDDGATWHGTLVNETRTVYWHDIEVASDAAGNLYALWNAYDGFVYYSASRDQGATWSPAVNVAPPGLTVTSYPMVAAGGPGEVAFLFMGTNHGPALIPGSHPSTRLGDMFGARWNWYLTVSLDADNDAPVFASVPLNDPDEPVAADACWPGYRHCDDVGEFVDLVIGPDGRPWASVFDSCRETCARLGTNEPRGGHRGAVLTLSEGPALNGTGASLEPLWYADALR